MNIRNCRNDARVRTCRVEDVRFGWPIGAVVREGLSVRPMSFSGTYADQRGIEDVVSVVQSSAAPGWQRRFEVRTTIRGIEVWGADFDGLSPDDESEEVSHLFNLAPDGSLAECVFSGEMPCIVEVDGVRREIAVRFELDLRASAAHPPSDPKNLRLSLDLGGSVYAVTDEWFADGIPRLERELPDTDQLICCVTCLYSDYSPYGHGLTGMTCHRDAKAQYLAVRSKRDYLTVPATEDVPETYLCPEYERRIPGTGYRG